MRVGFPAVIKVFLVVAALELTLSGCYSAPPQRINSAVFNDLPEKTTGESEWVATVTASRPPGGEPAYLGPGDLITINVFNPSDPDTQQKYELRASPEGDINVPQLDRVKVVGKTVSELEEDLARGFGKFIENPIVTVTPTYAIHAITVMGAVSHPGVYELVRYRSTVLDALTSAAGITDNAGDSVVVIGAPGVRLIPGNIGKEGQNPGVEAARRIRLDLDRLISGDMSLNLELEDGAFVWVPSVQPRYLYVQGYVRQPTRYRLGRNEQVTVLQAVAMAGGLTGLASASKVRVIKRTGLKHEEPVRIDLNKIASGKRPDLLLDAGDSVSIGTSIPRQVWWFVRGVLTFGVGWRWDF